MKKAIVTLAMMLVLVSTTIGFTNDDVNGFRGSIWGSSIPEVFTNESTQGGVITHRFINEKGLVEFHFNVPMKMGHATAYYVFDESKKLSLGGIIISMDENNWDIYYQNYNDVKQFLSKQFSTDPTYDSCQEIIILKGKMPTCQEIKVLLIDHIVVGDIRLDNEFKTKKTNVTIRLFGEGSLYAEIAVHYTPVQ